MCLFYQYGKSYTVWKNDFSRQNALYNGAVMWSSLCWTAFKQRQCKFVNVTRFMWLPYLCHPHTHDHIMHHWKHYLPRVKTVHSRIIKWCTRKFISDCFLEPFPWRHRAPARQSRPAFFTQSYRHHIYQTLPLHCKRSDIQSEVIYGVPT